MRNLMYAKERKGVAHYRKHIEEEHGISHKHCRTKTFSETTWKSFDRI